MTETIDTAGLRALAENIIAADGSIWWIEQDFRAVKEVLDATIDDARFVAAANPSTILALLDRLAAAEARNATLTDDAARYRWLRDFHQGEIRDELPHIAAGGNYVGAWALVGDEADAAIDAARKEKAA